MPAGLVVTPSCAATARLEKIAPWTPLQHTSATTAEALETIESRCNGLKCRRSSMQLKLGSLGCAVNFIAKSSGITTTATTKPRTRRSASRARNAGELFLYGAASCPPPCCPLMASGAKRYILAYPYEACGLTGIQHMPIEAECDASADYTLTRPSTPRATTRVLVMDTTTTSQDHPIISVGMTLRAGAAGNARRNTILAAPWDAWCCSVTELVSVPVWHYKV